MLALNYRTTTEVVWWEFDKVKKELKIYIDTSVIGGCYDDEFAEWSKKLIEEFKAGLYIPVVS